jgi:uncharacterized protein (TIGR03435 family)
MTRWITFVALALVCRAQSPDARQRFEVASVKPCGKSDNAGRGGGVSVGRIDLHCVRLRDTIAMAYGSFANGVTSDPKGITLNVEGGPGWVDSESWDLAAKAEGDASKIQMLGPMMQVLFEDRFKLKVHRETREVPVYTLTVAKGGPKLLATKEGSCVVPDPNHPPQMPAPGQPQLPACGGQMSTSRGIDMSAATIASLCAQLSIRMDRAVVDRTGISGIFDIHLELSPDDIIPAKLKAVMMAGDPQPPPSFDPVGSTIFDAVQKLGLKLEAGKGPGEFLVIDSVERPTEN